MSDTRPYTRMELNSPGVRAPLDWRRVVATADQFDAFSNEISAAVDARIAAAVAAEREAIARLIDADLHGNERLAAAIRARGGKL